MQSETEIMVEQAKPSHLGSGGDCGQFAYSQVWGSDFNSLRPTLELDMYMQACNPSAGEVEVGYGPL